MNMKRFRSSQLAILAFRTVTLFNILTAIDLDFLTEKTKAKTNRPKEGKLKLKVHVKWDDIALLEWSPK